MEKEIKKALYTLELAHLEGSILKDEIEKARTKEGVYANTRKNRKRGRVGKPYKVGGAEGKDNIAEEKNKETGTKMPEGFSVGDKVKLNSDVSLISLSSLKQGGEVVGSEKGTISVPFFLKVKDSEGKVHSVNPSYVSKDSGYEGVLTKQQQDFLNRKKKSVIDNKDNSPYLISGDRKSAMKDFASTNKISLDDLAVLESMGVVNIIPESRKSGMFTKISFNVSKFKKYVGESDKGTSSSIKSNKDLFNVLKNKEDWDDFSDQMYMKDDNLVVTDSFFYGEEKALNSIKKDWSPGGTYHNYFKENYGVNLEVKDSFSDFKATGRHKKMYGDSGVVGVHVSIEGVKKSFEGDENEINKALHVLELAYLNGQIGLDIIEKARQKSGVYANTRKNRKLGRVGQKYKVGEGSDEKEEVKGQSLVGKEIVFEKYGKTESKKIKSVEKPDHNDQYFITYTDGSKDYTNDFILDKLLRGEEHAYPNNPYSDDKPNQKIKVAGGDNVETKISDIKKKAKSISDIDKRDQFVANELEKLGHDILGTPKPVEEGWAYTIDPDTGAWMGYRKNIIDIDVIGEVEDLIQDPPENFYDKVAEHFGEPDDDGESEAALTERILLHPEEKIKKFLESLKVFKRGDKVKVGRYEMRVVGYTKDGRLQVMNVGNEKFTLSGKQTKEAEKSKDG